MILHYLVIWMIGADHSTRKETPIDLEIDNRDQDTADQRITAVKVALSDEYLVRLHDISIINICRL